MKTSIRKKFKDFNWKEHLRSMEESSAEEEETEEQEIDDETDGNLVVEAEFEDPNDGNIEVEVESELSPLSNARHRRMNDNRVITGPSTEQDGVQPTGEQQLTKEQMMMYIMWLSHEAAKLNAKNAKKIRKIKPYKLDAKPNALNIYVKRALQDRKEGLHIDTIIGKAIELGYHTKSKYHLYSTFSKLLNNNYDLYEKVGKAKFKLRSVVENGKLPTISKQPKKQFAKLQDVILMLVNKFNTSEGLYPSRVKEILDHYTGGSITYDQIYRALQDTNVFERDGFQYSVKKIDNNDKSKTHDEKNNIKAESVDSGSSTVQQDQAATNI